MAESENKKDFSYEMQEGFDFILEESANGSTNLRKIAWNGHPMKLDIRKYTYKDGQERMMRGVTLTDDGGTELANVLVENGYGDTKRLIKAIKQREDFNDSMLDSSNIDEDDSSDEEFYDPKELLNESA